MDDKTGTQKVCPGLGMVYDQSEHRLVSNPLHTCYYQTKPEVITLVHQETYCLSGNHVHCPIYLKKIQSTPLEITPIATENQKPEQRAFNLSNLQSLTLVTILLSVVLIILLVFLFTNSNSPGDSVTSSADEPMAVITYIITPTEITPNATWYAQLTQQAMLFGTPTLMSDLFPARTSIAFRSPTTIINCRKPNGWIVYTVDDGDTLQSLGRLTYSTVVDLMVANCMTINSVSVGQNIFLPYFPGSATATRTATRTPTRTPTKSSTSAVGPTSVPVLPSSTTAPTATNTFVPTVTNTKNPLFRDTPTPSKTSPPTATSIDTDTPIPTEEGTP
jgi:hypothetical protein